MADIFVSFDPEDRLAAEALLDILALRGYSTATEARVPPGAWRDNALELELHKARAVIVLWSNRSRLNVDICNQAAFAERHTRYIPVLIARCAPPLALLHVQPISLARGGGGAAQNMRRLLARLEDVTQAPRAQHRGQRPRRTPWMLYLMTILSFVAAFIVIGASGVPRNARLLPEAVHVIWRSTSLDALCKSAAGSAVPEGRCNIVAQDLRVARGRLRHAAETFAALTVIEAILWLAFGVVSAFTTVLSASASFVLDCVTGCRLARRIHAAAKADRTGASFPIGLGKTPYIVAR